MTEHSNLTNQSATKVLYHFTSLVHIEMIEREGALTRGDIPITQNKAANGVWLTSDSNPSAQAWGVGCPAIGAIDKQSVRLTVEIDASDLNLKPWSIYAREQRMSAGWLKTLDRTGGGGSLNWYIYSGPISLKQVAKVERLRKMYLHEFRLLEAWRDNNLQLRTFGVDCGLKPGSPFANQLMSRLANEIGVHIGAKRMN